ncbi:hypothetical protein B0T19DRAFT_406990 [Cercophora scortea]|uniref:Uncharacterized protein n=1 Tax=Cercophora scortea TaxID=314031 RepID=A0AAE0J3L3_9PEZI|nr:hypothetical protein B0T19DRAFT_406990 [Cercophora scortea]
MPNGEKPNEDDTMRRWVSDSDARQRDFENFEDAEEFLRTQGYDDDDSEDYYEDTDEAEYYEPEEEIVKPSWYAPVREAMAFLDDIQQEYEDEQRQARLGSGCSGASASVRTPSMQYHGTDATRTGYAHNLKDMQTFGSHEELRRFQDDEYENAAPRWHSEHRVSQHNNNNRGTADHQVMRAIREEDEDEDEENDDDDYETAFDLGDGALERGVLKLRAI